MSSLATIRSNLNLKAFLAGTAAGLIVLLLAALFLPARTKPNLLAPLPVRASLTAIHVAPTMVNSAGSDDSGDVLIILDEDRDDRVARLLEQAAAYYKARHFDKSMARAQQALRLDQQNQIALEWKIQARNALQDHDTSDRQLLDQANLYFLNGQYDGAALLYDRYMAQHPEFRATILPQLLKSYYNLGVIAMRQGRCDLASDYFRQNLLLQADDAASRKALNLVQTCLQDSSGAAVYAEALPALMR